MRSSREETDQHTALVTTPLCVGVCVVGASGGEFVDDIGDDGVDYVVAREEDLKDKTPTVEKALEIGQ